jgi:hypothetical protein
MQRDNKMMNNSENQHKNTKSIDEFIEQFSSKRRSAMGLGVSKAELDLQILQNQFAGKPVWQTVIVSGAGMKVDRRLAA